MPEQPHPTVATPRPDDPPGHLSTADAPGVIVIANEFADVVVRKVDTRNGMRLAIQSPRRGTTVLLDAVALDCLSFQPPELITELLTRNPGQ